MLQTVQENTIRAAYASSTTKSNGADAKKTPTSDS
jgi:hypothetical protein